MTLTPPPLSNDCFALPQGVDWTPVDDALALLRDRLGPVTGAERVALAEAFGALHFVTLPERMERENLPLRLNWATYNWAQAPLRTSQIGEKRGSMAHKYQLTISLTGSRFFGSHLQWIDFSWKVPADDEIFSIGW